MENKIDLKYKEILDEERIKLDELPQEIRLNIKNLNNKISEYYENPTKNLKNSIIKEDVSISNSIYDWIEEKEKEEEKRIIEDRKRRQLEKIKEIELRKKIELEKQKILENQKKLEEQKKLEQQKKLEETKNNVNKKYTFGDKEMSDKIKDKIKSNGGYILITELRSIIKREPNYPYQEVYDIKLHKPYMKPFYKILE